MAAISRWKLRRTDVMRDVNWLTAINDELLARVPAAYRAINDFLKPLRYEAWDYPYLQAPHGVDEMECTQWWTHRFDDGER
ncbi:hypothetical protein [Agrobacterium fabrum]|jgi:hypothetical protein|uniref:hypothetical protein n=1 Tax=Agrobacterium fabrum TaxID=1176649 RepID=UPI0021D06E2C|nr:hypothetical protein [Agrobacterium fabrum]